MKIRDLFAGFLEDCYRNGRKPSTIRTRKDNLERIIDPSIGDFQITKLRLSDTGLVRERATLHGGTSTPTHSMVTLRRLLRYAVGQGYKMVFDYRDIEIPPYRVQKDVQALDLKEIAQIREALAALPDRSKHTSGRSWEIQKHAIARSTCLFEFLLHTGLRVSEALSVNIQDLDFEKSEVRIVNAKTGEWETVYLHGCCEAIDNYLKLRTDECAALFVSDKCTRLKMGTAKSSLRMVRRLLGQKKQYNHKLLRSTFVTLLFRGRCDPKEVQRLARHKSLRTTLGHYYKVKMEQLRPLHARVMGKI